MKEKISSFLNSTYKENKINKSFDQLINSLWRQDNYTTVQKEIINSTIEFFYFTKHEENFVLLDSIFNLIEMNKKKIYLKFKENDFFYLAIIILKSFLYHSPIFLKNFGNFKNSDSLLDYCTDLYVAYCVFHDKNNDDEPITKKKIRGFFYIIFHLLIKNEVIIEKKIKTEKFLNKFWAINISKKVECDYQNFKLSYVPFSIKKYGNETYLCGLFFWNVYDIYSKNFYSNTKFNVTKEEYLDLLCKRHLHVDKKCINEIKMLYKDNLPDLEVINENLINELSNLRRDLNQMIKIKLVQKEYSKKIENLVLSNFLNIDFNERDKIYFPFYFDFRGRKYYNSFVGPTQNKILRFAYHYGWYGREDFSNLIKIKRINKFKNLIESFCNNHNYEYNDVFLESYFWLLIGIGKFSIIKKNIEIMDEVILQNGITTILKGYDDNLAIEEKVEIKHYITIMESLKIKNLDNIEKRIISKDGTASVYQVSSLMLGPKNQESLKWINLDNENCWVDTYSYIIQNFKKNNEDGVGNLDIFNRKTVKKILMTIPYSIGLKSAYDYFLKSLEEEGIARNDEKALKRLFEKFYKFVKDGVEKNYFYQKSTKEFTEEVMKEFLKIRSIPLKTETGETDLIYLKMAKKSIDLIFEITIGDQVLRERITKLIKVPTKSIDYNQTNISLGANLRHFYEADLLRMTEIYLNYSINSIHDAELIDFNACSKLILIKNRIFQDLLKNYKIWSLFIII